jgi:hypothetical protein
MKYNSQFATSASSAASAAESASAAAPASIAGPASAAAPPNLHICPAEKVIFLTCILIDLFHLLLFFFGRR